MKNIENLALKLLKTDKYLPMQIDITNFCNLSCTHCYHPHHKNDKALSLKEWIGIIDQYSVLIKKLYAKPYIIICGGEPLTSPFLNPILSHIKSSISNCEVTIPTNGTLISRYDLSRFAGLKVDFQVSLDGPSEEVHDSFRGKGNFTKAVNGIKILKENNFPVYLQATLTRKNSALIKEFFELASSLNANAMNFTRLIAVGEGANLSQNYEHSISPLELKKAFERIIIFSAKFSVRTDTELPLMNLMHPGLGKKYSFGESIVIDYQGYLLASSRSRVRVGKITDRNLEDQFFKNPLKKQFFDKKKFECFGCKHFDSCGGDLNVSYAEYGDFFKRDPGCWINIETA